MAQIEYRVNLSSPSFPLLANNQGRSIIVRGQDHAYVQTFENANATDKDLGIPQVYYCHNVLPTSQGFASVGFHLLYSSMAGLSTFNDIFILRDSAETRAYFATTTDGRSFYILMNSSTWVELTGIPNASGKVVTTAQVSGTTYIFFEKIGCYRFNFATNTLVSVTLAGLTVANILGIVGVVGYLIAWSLNAVAWSSTIDPTDFVPSSTTGAGGGSVEGARGAIVFCAPHNSGMIVYTTRNAVACIFSGNTRFPFNFTEIIASGGLEDHQLVVSDTNAGNQFTYTISGLQNISFQAATLVFPEITDFLAGELFEDFNETTNLFEYTNLRSTSTVMKKRLALIADRYLVISYGVTELTHALIYDFGLKRLGKIKLTHVKVFESASLSTALTTEVASHSIGFLLKSGEVRVLDSQSHAASTGVIILGKYQYVRNNFLDLMQVDIENVDVTDTFTCNDLPTLDGKTFLPAITGYQAKATGNLRVFNFKASGKNHSLLLKGAFDLNSILLYFFRGARR